MQTTSACFGFSYVCVVRTYEPNRARGYTGYLTVLLYRMTSMEKRELRAIHKDD